jgi:hypothetical protein
MICFNCWKCLVAKYGEGRHSLIMKKGSGSGNVKLRILTVFIV